MHFVSDFLSATREILNSMQRHLLFSLFLSFFVIFISCSHRNEEPEVLKSTQIQNRDSIAKDSLKHKISHDTNVIPLNEIPGYKPLASGKRINIAVIGVDPRIGETVKHADANHILSFLLDSGTVDIISIPRDTYADCGYKDSLDFLNKLTTVYAGKGVKRYLYEAAKIAELDTIPFYIEVGFSQAMGVMELLGYKDPSSTLRVLRSRKGLGGDDFQRSYNQGQFIRQALLKHYGKIDGLFGDVILRAGMFLVNTNLSVAKVKEIMADMNKSGFPKSPEAITVQIRPAMKQKFAVYDFTDEETIGKLRNKVDNFANYLAEHDTATSIQGKTDVQGKLFGLIKQAATDSASRPKLVIQRLQTPFDQHAWIQVEDPNARKVIRLRFVSLLSSAYKKSGKHEQVQHIMDVSAAEELLFEQKK